MRLAGRDGGRLEERFLNCYLRCIQQTRWKQIFLSKPLVFALSWGVEKGGGKYGSFWEVIALKHCSRRLARGISILLILLFVGAFCMPVWAEQAGAAVSSEAANAAANDNNTEPETQPNEDDGQGGDGGTELEKPGDGGEGDNAGENEGQGGDEETKPGDGEEGDNTGENEGQGGNEGTKPGDGEEGDNTGENEGQGGNEGTKPGDDEEETTTSVPVSSQAPQLEISQVSLTYKIKADGRDITNSFVRNGNVISGTVPNDISTITVTATTNTVGATVSVVPNGAVYLYEGNNSNAVKINVKYNGQTMTYTLSVTRQKAAGTVSEEENTSSEEEEVSSEPVSSEEAISSEAVSSDSVSSQKPIDSNLKDSNWMIWAAIALFILGAGGIGYVIYDQFFHGKKKGPRGGGPGGDDGANAEDLEEEETYDIMNESVQQQEQEDEDLSQLYVEPEEEEVKTTEIQDDWGNYFK